MWNRSSPTITDVVAKASGAADVNTGVVNTNAASPTLIGVNATASGAALVNGGVTNTDTSSATLINVTATGEGATSQNSGISNGGSSSPTLIDVTATGDGGSFAWGVRNTNSSAPTLFGVIATGKNGAVNNFGVDSSVNTVLLTIDASTLKGAIALRFGGNTGTRIANSRLIGTIANDPVGTTQCGGVYSATLAPVSC